MSDILPRSFKFSFHGYITYIIQVLLPWLYYLGHSSSISMIILPSSFKFSLHGYITYIIQVLSPWLYYLAHSSSVCMVMCRTPEREVRGSRPTAAVLCPWARHFTPRKYWLITQEAMAPSRHDWKIVDWDVKPQHNQICMVILPISFKFCLHGYIT